MTVCPHAGGVGLCELVQHLSAFDYIAVSGQLDGRMIEYVDHLHEHFIDPVVIRRRAVPAALDAGLQRRDAPRVAGALPLSRRAGLVVRRFGQVIRVKPGSIDAYERLHAETWPGVLAAIAAANIRNYSIYRHEELLFAYFEYVGDDLEADMAAMAADPTIVEWWALTDAMQVPYPEREPGSWWLTLPEVFHTD